ncbi:MAG: hypothetical protein IT314_02950 [Anaerolineales bacterium]|nr:hypothetical protein [Anaerolineales bacterium]
MNKRKRHAQKQSGFSNIEWLKHRTGYPSPEEREKIVEMRQKLSMELITNMVMSIKPSDTKVQSLVRVYGAEELKRAMDKISETMELPTFIADDAKSYREYRQRYARFGAGLKFYTVREMNELHVANLQAIRDSGDVGKTSELEKALLYGWRDWEDITPPAIPPRPDDFVAPSPESYPAPINGLLEWGPDLHRSHQFVSESDFMQWRKHIPALTRMALDPGLLNGWLTEPASWAPWHAMHALGALQAWESAPALAKLADLENDWLSDHLPHIWAGMGAEVESSLWMIIESSPASAKQRGLAANSLYMMSEDSEAMENKIVHGFEKLLRNEKSFNPTVNAYMIHFLREMEAVKDVWETVNSAFENGRVDLDVIAPEDLEDDGFDEGDRE